jgi:membrane protein DedA with SNARE-associated domain
LEIIRQFWEGLVNGNLPPLGPWIYVFLAILEAVEGPGTTILSGIAASAGLLRLPWVFIAAIVGNLSADMGWYTLGYRGRIEVLMQRLGWLRKYQSQMIDLKEEMARHAVKLLFIAKLTSSMAIPTLIATGIAHVSWRRWIPPVLLGEIIATGSLLLISYHLTEYIKQLELGLQIMAFLGAGILVSIVIRFLRHSSQPSDNHSTG